MQTKLFAGKTGNRVKKYDVDGDNKDMNTFSVFSCWILCANMFIYT